MAEFNEETTLAYADLMATEFVTPVWAVPGLIPMGVTNVAAAPKVGKSWFLIDVAIGIATGTSALGGALETPYGEVLYAGLESEMADLQHDAATIRGDRPDPGYALTFTTQLAPLAAGGLNTIENWIRDNNRARLVVIDILEHVRGEKSRSYAGDNAEIRALRKIAMERRVSIVVVTHTRGKVNPDAPFESIWQGIRGACEATMILFRPHGTNGTTCWREGKKAGLTTISFELRNGQFRMQSGAEAPVSEVPRPETLRSAVLRYLSERGEAPPRVIAEAIGARRNHVNTVLTRMKEAGEVWSRGGAYRLPEKPLAALNDAAGLPTVVQVGSKDLVSPARIGHLKAVS